MPKNQTRSENIRLENMHPGWPYKVVQGNFTLREGYSVRKESNGSIFCDQLAGWLSAKDIATLDFLCVLVAPDVQRLTQALDLQTVRQRAMAFLSAL